MKKKNKRKTYTDAKRQILLSNKIINTLTSFVRTGHSTSPKKSFSKTLYPFKNKKLIQHSIIFNESCQNNNSQTEMSKTYKNNSYMIDQEKKFINPLYILYNNKYYPHSYKNKNYIKEVYQCLPPLKIVNINNYKEKISKNYNKKLNEIISNEYENTVHHFHNIYKDNGEDLFNDLGRSKELDNESVYEVIKQNEININESNYISSVLRDKNKKKNYSVKLRHEKFTSPENSLLTLKINNQVIKNLKEASANYQYNSYVDQINENQKNKLKLLIMPKMNIKVMKFAFELNKNQNNFDQNKTDGNQKSKKLVTMNKNLFRKINKKMDKDSGNINNDNKKEKDKEKDKDKENNDNNQPNSKEKMTINSTIMRNMLILEVKSYYCKYLLHSNVNPCSRMGATFTNYYNKLFLFGGLLSSEQSDLWMLEIRNKVYTWKKIQFSKEITFNPRYGHSCVLFNNSLYIFGGNMNLKKLKYPLEDILIYNIKTNTMKIGSFKNEKYTFNPSRIYVPQRRNHIAQAIGWNMIVYGGIDISKEYLKDNHGDLNQEEIRVNETEIKNVDINGNVLGDFMALDLVTFKWMNLSNIVYKIKEKKSSKKITNGIPRVYHSSCLVLSYENLLKGNKLNIYKNNTYINEDLLENEMFEEKQKFEIKYEGIYIFGGLDEYFKDTNNLFILHCFRNPLVFFEPVINGAPPSPRHMSVMNFNKILNFITIYGGKDLYHIYNDLFILDIMNFQWIKIELFGPESICGRMGHCGGIINEKLYIFGGCDENNKYPSAQVLCIELDLLRNKKMSKIYEFAKSALIQNSKDRTAKNVISLLNLGAEIPHDIYPFLHLDE